jgi:hypothetical protein
MIRTIWTQERELFLNLVFEPIDETTPYRFEKDESSLAARAGTEVGEYDIAVLGGQVAGDRVIGGDFTGYVGDAGLRGELIYSHVRESDQRDYWRGVIYGRSRKSVRYAGQMVASMIQPVTAGDGAVFEIDASRLLCNCTLTVCILDHDRKRPDIVDHSRPGEFRDLALESGLAV